MEVLDELVVSLVAPEPVWKSSSKRSCASIWTNMKVP